MKVLENRFKEIQWDLDTVIQQGIQINILILPIHIEFAIYWFDNILYPFVQQEDDKDLNGTREELEQLNYKVDLIETQLEKHGYSHIQTTLEGNFLTNGALLVTFSP